MAQYLMQGGGAPAVETRNEQLETALDRVFGIPELLANILNHCERRDLAVACVVCSTWDTIIGSLTYYSTLVMYRPQDQEGASALFRGLSRGGDRQVTIMLPGISIGDRDLVLGALRQHSHRIVRLAGCQLTISDVNNILSVVLRGMPVLREFALQRSVVKDGPEVDIRPSFQLRDLVHSAPRLKRLVASGVIIDGPYEDATTIDIIEISMRAPDEQITAFLWLAPWPIGTTVNGVAIREGCFEGSHTSWVMTAWCGTLNKTTLSEPALRGKKVHSLVHRSRETYRRIVLHQYLPQIAFNYVDITVISMPLYFWGLVRHQVGDLLLPNLVAAHLRMVELHDDSEGERGNGRLKCPRLRHVGLEVEKVEGIDAEDWPWEHYIPCTADQVIYLVNRIVSGPDSVLVDLLGTGFDVLMTEDSDAQLRLMPTVDDFGSWLATLV